MLGGGFLKAMSDSMAYNRSLLGKSKREPFSRKDYYERHSEGEPIDVEILNGIVSTKLKRKVKRSWLVQLLVGVLAALAIGVLYAGISEIVAPRRIPSPYENPKSLFQTRILPLNDSLELRSYFYDHGAKAGQAFYSRGRRHLTSESYYPTGETFHASTYQYDSLLTDIYFYKDGDTIRNMPVMLPGKVYHVTLPGLQSHPAIRFDCFEGKIILGTYREENLPAR